MGMDSEQRPRGSWRVIDVNDGYKIKRIHVNPGCRLSLQTHEHRSEHWVVIRAVPSPQWATGTLPSTKVSRSTCPSAPGTAWRTPATTSSSSSRCSWGATLARTTSAASRTTTAADLSSRCPRCKGKDLGTRLQSEIICRYCELCSLQPLRSRLKRWLISRNNRNTVHRECFGGLRGARDLAGATRSHLPPDDL